jgi:hypothetical protein
VWSDIYDNSGVLSAYLFYKIQTDPWDSTTADSIQNDTTYFFAIPAITPPKVIRYYIKAYDNSANNNVSTDPPGAPGVVYQFIANPPGVSEEIGEQVPHSVYLTISPNPTISKCLLNFGIPKGERISLSIYNILGARVKTIIANSILEGGHYLYDWRARDERGRRVSSGIYFARLEYGKRVVMKPIIISR